MDDTPVKVQEPGSGKTRTARLWAHVRDERNAGSKQPPAVWFNYTPDRKGIHPQTHLKHYQGVRRQLLWPSQRQLLWPLS